MKIICEDHGAQNGILISRDLSPFAAGKSSTEYYRVRLNFKDGVYDEYLLSNEFCKQNNIQPTDLHAEIDDFPAWCNLLLPICIKCAEKTFHLPSKFPTNEFSIKE